MGAGRFVSAETSEAFGIGIAAKMAPPNASSGLEPRLMGLKPFEVQNVGEVIDLDRSEKR